MQRSFLRRPYAATAILALAFGLILQFTAVRSEAIIAILIGLRSGPTGLTRGTEAVMGVYVPLSRTTRGSVQVVNSIKDGTSNIVVGQETLSLTPGGPCGWVRVRVLDNGSVLFNGRATSFTVPEGGQLQILSQVQGQAPRGTQLVGTFQITNLEDGRVLALLPYIEQGN